MVTRSYVEDSELTIVEVTWYSDVMRDKTPKFNGCIYYSLGAMRIAYVNPHGRGGCGCAASLHRPKSDPEVGQNNHDQLHPAGISTRSALTDFLREELKTS